MESSMKAVVQHEYGSQDLLELAERDTPVPEVDEVLVRVRAASVHPDVWHVVRGLPYVLRLMGGGLLAPNNPVPGTDVSGRVKAVGENVIRFDPGDEVFGETIRGHQWTNGGAYAEYVAAPAEALALKPPVLTFEEAAAVPTSGLIALQGVHYQGQVQSGQKVLINGAGGGVGTFAVQIAKASGADVTGVDSTEKLDTIRSIGADHLIDYSREDFTNGEERYDLIVDIPGNHPFSACRQVLSPAGTYVLIGHDGFGAIDHLFGSIPRMVKLMVLSPFIDQLVGIRRSTPSKSDSMTVLKEFLEAGNITPLVDKTFPLSDVPEAIRYLESGQPQGKIVISVSD